MFVGSVGMSCATSQSVISEKPRLFFQAEPPQRLEMYHWGFQTSWHQVFQYANLSIDVSIYRSSLTYFVRLCFTMELHICFPYPFWLQDFQSRCLRYMLRFTMFLKKKHARNKNKQHSILFFAFTGTSILLACHVYNRLSLLPFLDSL